MDLTRANLDQNILNIIACGYRHFFALQGMTLFTERTIKGG